LRSKMELTVKNTQGKSTGRKVKLSAEVFDIQEPNDHLIWQDVRLYLANQRQGTHKTKERGEVSGSTKKPFRQKGTGGARSGHKRSPLWRHGGTIFGPRPRDYGFKLNIKAKRLARTSALTYKAKEQKITVLEGFNMDSPKTKEFLAILNNLELANSKILLVLPEENRNIYLSGRNLPKTKVVKAIDINTYDIVNADMLVFVEGSVQIIESNMQEETK